jgi:hypothetical protein
MEGGIHVSQRIFQWRLLENEVESKSAPSQLRLQLREVGAKRIVKLCVRQDVRLFNLLER